MRPILAWGLLASLLATLSTGLSGCSTAAVYDVIAANTKPDCSSVTNPHDRSACMKRSDVPYEDYEAERQKAKSAP